MEIERTPGFERSLRERANRRIKRLFRDRLSLFLKNPYDESLRNHALKHRWAGHRSFSLTDDRGEDDYRVVFRRVKGRYVFIDFGTHAQLYRPWQDE